MFGIGLSEIILVILIVIIFIKPDDLPKFLRSAGRLYGKLKKTYNEIILVKDRFIKEINETVTLEEQTSANAPKIAAPEDKPSLPAAAGDETPKAEV
jgi:sec-independent protein translocase protein TatB